MSTIKDMRRWMAVARAAQMKSLIRDQVIGREAFRLWEVGIHTFGIDMETNVQPFASDSLNISPFQHSKSISLATGMNLYSYD
jgi:hypothetical protein